jgi:hypothetical protein
MAMMLAVFLFWLPFGTSDVNQLVQYPVKLLPPVTGHSFSSNISHLDGLLCFGNQDYRPATYLESLYCIIGLDRLYDQLYSCHSLWGSRSVSISVEGSVEFLQTSQLPRESDQMLNVTHWLHLSSNSYYSPHHRHQHRHQQPATTQEIKLVDADLFYLCARCNDWQRETTATFSLKLRPAFTRAKARGVCFRKMIFGGLYLLGLSIPGLSPLLKAGWATHYVFLHGLNVFILLTVMSLATLLTTPFVLTKKNRSSVRRAYKHFFSTLKVSFPALPPSQTAPLTILAA